ncbi:MAG: CapA family protein [Candidatus Faecousia sp.]|nr:CapA family protein [Candidatus Faecousia sp.]
MKHLKNNRGSALVGVLTLLIVALIIANAAVIGMIIRTDSAGHASAPTESPTIATEPEAPTETETEPPTTTMPEPEHVVSTATILSTGDLVMHIPVVNTGLQSDGSYNFDSIFRYITDYVDAADYSVVNLETTLAGTDNGFPYAGYPRFNCPDALANATKSAGFDMLLTANNHSFDTTLVGYKRTLEVVRELGLETLGTYLSADEQKWTIEEINGIKVGMLCYTYATGLGPKGTPRLNGNAEIGEAGICNYFTYDNLPAFYSEVQGYLDEMKAAGAEATMIYMHWGVEYVLAPNEYQTAMAQKLCDLGFDVIIGGHPHVVQPVDLLQSNEDPDHKTVVLYSMGNAVSNQRMGNISSISTPHTEDGILFSVTFSKYSDDTVYLENVSAIPTWVNLNSNNGSRQYNIVPLDDSIRSEWMSKFNMTENEYNSAQRSYDRTSQLVDEGIAKSQEYLSQQKQAREAAYLAAVQNAA